jgi:hypothetical protein
MTGHKKQDCYEEGGGSGGSYDSKKAKGKKTDVKGDDKNVNKAAPCLLCGKTGYKATQCKEKTDFAGNCSEVKNQRHLEQDVSEDVECLTVDIHSDEKTVDELWLIDSRATTSITPDERGMINKEPSNQRVIAVGDGSVTNAKCKGELLFLVLLDGGMMMRVSAIYVPGFHRHVLSVDSLIRKGSKIEMNSSSAHLISEASGKVVNFVNGEQGMSYL